jgi:voltage-gated potassium channel
MFSATSKFDFDIMEFKVIEDNPYIGKDYNSTFIEMRELYNCVLLGIYHKGELFKNPSHEIFIEENDYLILIANGETKKEIQSVFKIRQGRY